MAQYWTRQMAVANSFLRMFEPRPVHFCLKLIHLIGIPVTNLAVNPARSTGPAFFLGGWALMHLWLFWIALITGAAVAGIVHRQVFSIPDEK